MKRLVLLLMVLLSLGWCAAEEAAEKVADCLPVDQ